MSRSEQADQTATTEASEAGGSMPAPPLKAASVSLSDLPLAGLTRRRIALLLGALVSAWVILLFAHQVGEASAASAKAEAMRASNSALATDVASLQAELDLIQRQAYVEQQARAYRLGGAHEIPFALADNAPSLAPDAPGSAGVRLGAVPAEQPSPLQQWIRLLFGPAGDPANP